MSFAELLEIVIIVIIPPLGILIAGLEKRVEGGRLCIQVLLNLFLTLLFFLPGLVHGIYMLLVFSNEEKYREMQLMLEQQHQRDSIQGTKPPDKEITIHTQPA